MKQSANTPSAEVGIEKTKGVDGFPTVSIIISNFNGKKLLPGCLNSLLCQDYPAELEIIVVDAGSTDGTPDLVEDDFPNVTLIRKGRIGIGEALNIGLRLAQGEVLAFDINSDEILSPTWLRILVSALLRIPNAGVVGCVRLVYGTKSTVDDAGGTLSYLGITSTYARVRLSDIPQQPFQVDYVGSPVFRRDLLNSVGLCDETYVLYSEDEDFCARVKQSGRDIILVPQAISYHRRSATIGQASPLAVYYERRNHIRFIIKNFNFPRMFLALFWHVFLLTAVDALAFAPYAERLIASKESRLSFIFKESTKQNFRAVISALCWNLVHLKSSILARRVAESRDMIGIDDKL